MNLYTDCVLLIGLAMLWTSPAFAQSTTVRGRVFTTDSTVIVNATVSLSKATGSSATVTTDRWGVYSLQLPSFGRYSVTSRALGYLPAESSLDVDGTTRVVIMDVYLTRVPAVLDAVKVVARRKVPLGVTLFADATNRSSFTMRNSELVGTADLNLATLAASAPGVIQTAGGFSAFGLPADQNSILLNGLEFPVGTLPRGVMLNASMITGSSDPSRGGFSGGQLTIQPIGGANFHQRSAHASIQDFPFSSTSSAGRGRNIQVSGNASGPVSGEDSDYTLSWQVGEAVQPSQSLNALSAGALATTGVSAGNVMALATALRDAGLGAALNERATQQTARNASLFTQFRSVDEEAGTSANVVASGSIGRADGAQSDGRVLVPVRNSSAAYTGALQFGLSHYLRRQVLQDVRIGLSASHRSAGPALSLPYITVDALESGTIVPVSLIDGGRSSSANQLGLTAQHELAWYTPSGLHRWRVTVNGNVTHSESAYDTDLGAYTFQSVDAFTSGTASSFRHGLSALDGRGRIANASVAIGDAWQVAKDVRVLYGSRADIGVLGFDNAPGARTMALDVKSSILDRAISPRAGLTWNMLRTKQPDGSPGDITTIVRASVGAYHNALNSSLIPFTAGALRESCFDADIPTVRWSGVAATEADAPVCAVQTHGRPSAAGFSPNFEAPNSWRGAIGMTHDLKGRLHGELDVTQSVTSNLRSTRDANLQTSLLSHLASEGDRPVFAPLSKISAAGEIDPVVTRRNSALDRITLTSSERHARATSVTAALGMVNVIGNLAMYGAYTLTRSLQEYSGFDESTSGDPTVLEWSRGRAPRHQLSVNASGTIGGVSAELLLTGHSGVPLTPIVAGDVNGDGFATNDRPFLRGENDTHDAIVASELTRLIRSSPLGACLTQQRGRIAAAASCTEPSFVQADASFEANGRRLGTSDRLQFHLNLTNLLGLSDAILHGANGRGWGENRPTDPVVLRVTGFDQSTQSFRYSVNQNFGSPLEGLLTSAYNYRISLGAEWSFGPSRKEQVFLGQVRVLAKLPGVPDSSALSAKLRAHVPGVARLLLIRKDSLRLTDSQVQRLRDEETRFQHEQDAIWGPLASYLASLKLDYGRAGAADEYSGVSKRAYESAADAAVRAGDVLTPEQRRGVPIVLQKYLRRDDVLQRMYDRY